MGRVAPESSNERRSPGRRAGMIRPREKHSPQNGEASHKTASADRVRSHAFFTRSNINVARDLTYRFVPGLFGILLVAFVAVLIPSPTHSQSGRQKSANTNTISKNSN